MKKLNSNNSGFTLIELIVVMVIIGILVLLATPRFLNYIKDANITALQVDVKTLEDAALYYSFRGQGNDNDGGYPVGETVTLSETDDKELIEVIKYTLDETYTGSQDFSDMKFAKLSESAVKDHVRNTKNNIEDYIIVTDGPLVGNVFYTSVLQNSMDASFAGLIGMPAKVAAE